MWQLLVVAAFAQSAHDAVADVALGKRIFDSQCTVCHGQGGTGGRGPALTKPLLPKAPDDGALRKVIAMGLPPEMPGSWQLSVREVASVAGYVRSLGSVKPEPLPGDAGRGFALFKTTGCSGCHLVNGVGTAVGPDLSAIGARRNAAFLKRAMVEPSKDLPDGYLLVNLITAEGKVARGVVAAEDPFSIQIRYVSNGNYESFRKSGLKEIQRQPGESTMPAYGNLPAGQVDDLVAYLASLRGDSK
ncbi:MAG: c-type cytochrome [Bryobacterales bacterium]|nr:c-type cytochrome [Bryobacterales bacterium]